jgi:hypothetical protein
MKHRPVEVMNDLAPLIGTGMVGTFILIGLKMIVGARRGGREMQDDLQRLAETVERLEDQVNEMRMHSGELAERVDFTERLLGRATEVAPREPGS